MTDVAKTGRFFMEGFMYRCHPQIERLVELIGSGEIRQVQHIEAAVLVLLPESQSIHVWTILLWLGERFSTWVSIQSPLLGWWLEQPRRACRSRNRWRFRQSALSVP